MHTCHCGKEVRLGAQRITVERRSGVYHYIIHVDGTEACDGPWTCIAVKPYPKDENQKEYAKLIRRWNAHQSTAKETRDDLWNPHGNDGMRHMESADVTGGATYMVGRCIHGTKHTDGDGCPHCQR